MSNKENAGKKKAPEQLDERDLDKVQGAGRGSIVIMGDPAGGTGGRPTSNDDPKK